MGVLSSIASGLSAALQWGLALFKAKQDPTVVRAAEANRDESTIAKVNADLAKGDPADLGKDIAQ